jgi:hypothetical protein
VKVRVPNPTAPSVLGRLTLAAALALPLALAIMLGPPPTQAHAITRQVVLKRANHWIKKRVKYSQSGSYGGYRRDCSGFVSMAWKLKRSYTSSTIRSKTRRIAWRSLKPGDAVRRPGHVEIFSRWKNKRRRTYVALEESTWGKPALRRTKRFESGCSALRYRHISMPKTKKHTKAKPKRPVTPPVVVPDPGVDTSASVTPTAAAPVPGADATTSVVPTSTPLTTSFLIPSAFGRDSRA